MSGFDTRRRPRQFPGPFNPFSAPNPFAQGNVPSNLIVPPPPPTAEPTLALTSGFFQPPAAETVAAAIPELTPAIVEPQITLTASDPPVATDVPAPVVFPEVAPAPAPEGSFVDGDFSMSVQPDDSLALVSEGVEPTQVATEVLGEAPTDASAALPTQSASANMGGVAFGAIGEFSPPPVSLFTIVTKVTNVNTL